MTNAKYFNFNDCEITHYYNCINKDYIASRGNVFFGSLHNKGFCFTINFSKFYLKILARFRFARRTLRLDKSNVIYCQKENVLYVIYQSKIYYYDFASTTLTLVHQLRQSRNALHGGICLIDGYLYVGEYGNSGDLGVPIWKGRLNDWEMIYSFPAGKIKHIHGVFSDEYEDKIWVTTGDFDGQCYLLSTSDDFRNVEYLGDGTQQFRTVGLLFDEKGVFWATDSPLVDNKMYIYDRTSLEVKEINQNFLAGPVWYMKKLADGYLIQTSVEKGPAVKSKHVEVFYSRDLYAWTKIFSIQKDCFPNPLFKNGVIAFSDGPQSVSDFVCHAEAVSGLDGKSFKIKVDVRD